ncbi:MAG: hypothetical protein A2942_01285 [Candidatus Lloydbacteria bacterium RIFCSPLOWO2_01_FULL_50_20]|uniref:Uncharacterized protein n=1 Tax=Candidatus Lloydbacteria bacterium RIFCSPLOWO2_01_FULL_50_20 TaxID=1798665 RepID=A0A1G2DIM4_9BACT|nr:MAG: hypothetical protein A3C13_00830 [Candidatus Lloydbacteria bacterium RIFCSPHIGHO2_02_FULL_50_11]OGZ13459.1 MAG: hypothetical protein A2942_01285 [Candidatus Lloydbacteria bacterium RIFCSPLOWO2_01_FULL_50_20]
MSKQSFFSNVSAFILLFSGWAVVAHAQTSMYQNPITYGGIRTIPDLLIAIVDLVFLIAVPIIVIFIIYSGFLFVTSGDNEANIKKAKTVFMWTVVGALVLLGAKAISAAIQSTILSLGAT